MADPTETSDVSEAPVSVGEAATPSKAKAERRKIPGNLPYTSSSGALKKVLEQLPRLEKPKVFNSDFLGTVLQVTGGSARPIPPIFKATGLLNASGSPTELYSQFQTETGRAQAALQALRSGYSEIFRRNQFAHVADERTLLDIIVSVTGLPKNDGIVRHILNTFQTFQEFAKGATESIVQPEPYEAAQPAQPSVGSVSNLPAQPNGLGLVYNINVVLPETTNVDVYNAIFKSLKGNLLL